MQFERGCLCLDIFFFGGVVWEERERRTEEMKQMRGAAGTRGETYADGEVECQGDGAEISGREGEAGRGEEVAGVGQRAHEDGP